MKNSSERGFISRFMAYVLAAAVATGLGLLLGQRYFQNRPQAAAEPTTAAALQTVRLIEPARPLGAFSLMGGDGIALSPASLHGHWTVVFLGFTHCPDVCPTTLADLARAQKTWESLPDAIRPRVLFVSVDPQRDTPRVVAHYAHFFHPATLAATANEPELGEFAKSLGLVYMKVSTADGDYSIDHSATLVVLDPQGRQAGLIRPPLKSDAIAADLKLLAQTRP